MRQKRILTILLTLAIVTAAAVGGWIAGSSIQSPAEVAARTAPPQPSPILVPVEKRTLTSDIVTRGTARFRLPLAISIATSALKSGPGVITTLPLANASIEEGDVVLTASGRPLFVLQGELPVYRDLVPDLTGDDVLQLETALARLGFDPGAVDGVYDESTSAAVAAWNTAAGWQPFAATPGQLAAIRSLESELAIAENNKLNAQDDLVAASDAITVARSSAAAADALALADVQSKTAILDKVNADPTTTNADRTNATADLTVAQANASTSQLAGLAAIQTAINVERAARRQLALAVAAVERIAADLETARRQAAVQVPVDEIVFVPAMPIRIEKVNVAVGDPAIGPVLAVTNFQLAIDSSLRLDEGPLVKPGMIVNIDEPDLGIKATGVVGRVEDRPGTFGVDGFHVYFEVLVDETPVNLVGSSLRLTIPVQSTGGAVLAVPVSALSLTADGTSRVQVDNGGALEFVVVEPGLSAGGYAEVRPISGTLEAGQLVVIGFEQ